jgi:hypothetical protein
VALLESACHDDPGEPTFRLDLADALVAAGRGAEAMGLTAAVEADPSLTWPLRARAASLAAFQHFHAGRFPEAEQAVRRALALATDEGEERTNLAKLRALATPAARATVGRVLFGDSTVRGVDAVVTLFLVERFAESIPREAFGPYLMARQLTWRDPRLALPFLTRACPLDGAQPLTPLAPLFLRECQRMTGEAAFRAGNLALSRAAFQHLASPQETDNEAERLRARDFLERIGWEESRPPAASR